MAQAQGPGKRAGKKVRRSAKHKTYHAAQFMRTERNKLRRKQKRISRLAAWREKGTKKNGELVRIPITGLPN